MITSLSLDGWPVADRLAWLRACEPGEGRKRCGAASRWKPTTREDIERRYGYFLESLRERGVLDPKAGTGKLVTPENVDCYIERVRSGWTSVTLAGSVRKLRTMSRILTPAADLDWLTEIANDLDLVAYPLERFDRIVTSEVLIRAGLTLVKEAQMAHRRRPIWRAGQIRDGLMVAMLAYCPIRLKNFSALELGRSFVREQDRWGITLPGTEVKNGRSDLRLIRARLNPAIAMYLTWARPRLMRHTGEFMIGEERKATSPLMARTSFGRDPRSARSAICWRRAAVASSPSATFVPARSSGYRPRSGKVPRSWRLCMPALQGEVGNPVSPNR